MWRGSRSNSPSKARNQRGVPPARRDKPHLMGLPGMRACTWRHCDLVIRCFVSLPEFSWFAVCFSCQWPSRTRARAGSGRPHLSRDFWLDGIFFHHRVLVNRVVALSSIANLLQFYVVCISLSLLYARGSYSMEQLQPQLQIGFVFCLSSNFLYMAGLYNSLVVPCA